MNTRIVRGASVALLVAVGLSVRAAQGPPQVPSAATPAIGHGQSATELPDGTLLLAGGRDAGGQPGGELWLQDPRSGQRTQLPASLLNPRAGHSATLLPDGSVLIVGGVDRGGQIVTRPEVYRPDARSLEPTTSIAGAARAFHTATVLPDGRVLFAGGTSSTGDTLASFDIWDPSGTRPKVQSSLPDGLRDHTATLAADGRVVLTPRNAPGDGRLQSSFRGFLIDPSTGAVSTAPAANAQRLASATRAVESLPRDGAQELPLDLRIALRFSDALRVSTVNTTTVRLVTEAGAVVDATVVPTEGGRLVFVTPRDLLRPEATYLVLVENALSASGGPVQPIRLSFTTAADSADPEDWDPDTADAASGWRTRRASTEWQALPPLQAPPGVTALAGQALRLNGRPLARMRVAIDERETLTDATGRFLLVDLEPGHHEMLIDGAPARRAGRSYGVFEVGVDIHAGETTALDYTIWMTPLDTKNAVRIPSPTSRPTVITTPALPGLEFHLPAGATVTDHDWDPAPVISITAIPLDRPPFPLPRGVIVPIYFTVQPGGGYIRTPSSSPVRGGRLIYPNTFRQRPGTRFDFWNYDPEGRGWYIYGQGTVTADARQIVPDAGVEVYELTGAMVASTGFAPFSGPGGGGWGGSDSSSGPSTSGGDPVDLFTGLFVYSKTDLVLPGPIPVSLTRTYRQSDYITRAFGVGTTHPYDMFLIGDYCPFDIPGCYAQADLVLADGGRVHFVRTSPGYDFVTAVFAHSETQSAWHGATLRWNGNGWDLVRRDGMKYTFPSAGNATTPQQGGVTRITDRFGNRVDVSRGTQGRVNSIRAGDGRSITFSYDTSHRVIQAQDNAGHTVTYAYDTVAGTLTEVTDSAGGVTRYGYDEFNEMTWIRDPRGITYLTNQYGDGGRVVKQTMADGGVFRFAYSSCGAGCYRTQVTDPRGIVRRVTYNSKGLPMTDIEAVGRPEQRTTSYVFHPTTNLMTSVTNPLGHQTTFTHDSKGNPLTTTTMSGTPAAAATTRTYATLWSDLLTVTDALSHTTTITYDGRNALASITDPLSQTTTFTSNALGQPAVVTNALSHEASIAYDGGDLVGVTDPRGASSTAYHDALGRRVESRDALGARTRVEYDAAHRVSRITDSLDRVTLPSYDDNGNVLAITDPLGQTTSYAYDSMDRVVRRTDALGRIDTFAYDLNGNVISMTDRRGAVTTYTYDGLNRPLTMNVTVPQAPTLTRSATYTYDALDRLTQAMDSLTGTLTRTYDDVARTVTETTPLGSTTWAFDAVGRRTSMAVSGQAPVIYTHDAADRLTDIVQGASHVVIGYDAANRRTSLALPNGVTTEYAYDTASLLTGLTYKLGATTLGTITYGYDANGRRTSVGGSWARAVLPAPVTASYDAANQLTRWGTASIGYDATGHLQSDGAQSYTWDGRGQLASVTGATSTTFGYDAVGRRVSLTTGGATRQFRYDGGNVVEERDGTGAVTGSQLGGLMLDEVYERIGSGGVRAPVVDALGSVLAEFDSAGGVTGQYSYGPFGQTTTTGATSLPQQWTGRERDTSTGLYYHRARYYSPTFGRFLSEDPLEFGAGDVNLHAYAFSDPTNLTDPTGEIVPALIVSCAGGALFDAGWQVASNLSSRKSPAALDGVAGAALRGCAAGLLGDGLGYALRYALPRAAPALAWLFTDETGSLTIRAGKRFGDDAAALVDLAKEARRNGTSLSEAGTLLDWANEYGVRPALDHINTDHWIGGAHIRIGPINHIPVRK